MTPNMPKDISFTRIVSAREKGTAKGDTAKGGARLVRIPVAEHINNGEGANFYLKQRDKAGRPFYYLPETWDAMTDKQRSDACDFSLVADAETGKRVAQFMDDFDGADPLKKALLIDRIAAALEERKASAKKAVPS